MEKKYFIQMINPPELISGKKIGTFEELVYKKKYKIWLAKFTNLHVVPGAKLKSGLGTSTVNEFSHLGHKFFSKEMSPDTERKMNKFVLFNKTGMDDPQFFRSC